MLSTGVSQLKDKALLVLHQNIPNPFADETFINYYLPSSGETVITIFDIQGKIVAVPVKEIKSAGNHSLPFQKANLAVGIYYYEIKYNNISISKKMIISR